MADFGFVGASYTAPSIYQNDSECINFYPEIDITKQPGERGIVALYPTPGLVKELQLDNAAIRGMRTLSGGNIMLAVAGNKVYAIDRYIVATFIGTLTTSKGQVSISDNVTTSDGLTAYIVDGVNRYTWVAATSTFIQLPDSDGPWQGGTTVDVVDNYNVYSQGNSQLWAATDLGSSLSTNQYFGSKDGSPDNLVALIVDHRQVYLLGEVTSEVWNDTGNVIAGIISFPFSRVPGTALQHGCAAKFSIARFSEQFMFVSKNTRGQVQIGAIVNYAFQRISTHAVENTLVGKAVDDAVAFTYQIEGHEFYVVTFPSIDLTWVYDLSTKAWHKWLCVDSKNQFHRHRANCMAAFQNQVFVGDYDNGKIYSLHQDVYTDDGAIIKRVRRAVHLTADLQRQYFDEMQIQFQPGVGLQQGQGVNPQAMLRWSNDGGSTWSNEHWTIIGRIGKYLNRAIWRRLGWSRDRIFEVTVTDPIRCVIISANLKATGGEN